MEKIVKIKPKKSVDQEMEDLFHAFKEPRVQRNPWYYLIWDTDQKYLFLLNNTLVAARKDSISSAEILSVVPNRDFKNNDSTIYPIFIGLHDGKHVLSSDNSGAQTHITIVEKDIMYLYKKREPFKNYTFLVHPEPTKQPGTMESAAFPELFISTSTLQNKPIGLSRMDSAEIVTFYFEEEN